MHFPSLHPIRKMTVPEINYNKNQSDDVLIIIFSNWSIKNINNSADSYILNYFSKNLFFF